MPNQTACACGANHTVTLSDDGTAHSFGRNFEGQLGLGHNDNVSLPTPIPNLPKINMVSCGVYFTVCLDHEGFIWSFGANDCGQLGTGNEINFNVPQKITDIPPVVSVSCGSFNTLINTNDSNLWSWGYNADGELCHGYTESRLIPKHHFQTYQKYQLVILIHYFKITTEKYLHAVIIQEDNVDWVILILLKSHQVSFPIYLQILFNLFVELGRVYFLIQKETYFLLGIINMAN